jgi:hypothetical protein
LLVLLRRHVRERKNGDRVVGEGGVGAGLADGDDGRVLAREEAVAEDDRDENADRDEDRPVTTYRPAARNTFRRFNSLKKFIAAPCL